MSAIDDAIEALNEAMGKIGESQQAQQLAVGGTEQALTAAEALGADALLETVTALKDKVDELAAVLAQADSIAGEALGLAESVKT